MQTSRNDTGEKCPELPSLPATMDVSRSRLVCLALGASCD